MVESLEAGQVKGELVLDGKKFNSTLTKAGKNAEHFEKETLKSTKKVQGGFSSITKSILKTVATIGGLYVAFRGLKNAITKTANLGDSFQKAAQRIGVSAEALSEFAYVAKLSGTSINNVEMSFRVLSKRMLDAKRGLSTAKMTFKDLGIAVKNTDGSLRRADDVFMDAVKKINALKSETEKTALAQELFGRSGTAMLPIIRAGKKGIAAMREEAHRLGITFSQVEANQAAAFEDAMTRLSGKFEGIRKSIGLALLPSLTVLANHFATTSGSMNSRVKTLAENMRLAFIAIIKTGALVSKAIDGIRMSYHMLDIAAADISATFAKGAIIDQISAIRKHMDALKSSFDRGEISSDQYNKQIKISLAQYDSLEGSLSSVDDSVIKMVNDLVDEATATETAKIKWQAFITTLEEAGKIETPEIPKPVPPPVPGADARSQVDAYYQWLMREREKAASFQDKINQREMRWRNHSHEQFIQIQQKEKIIKKQQSLDRIKEINKSANAIKKEKTLAIKHAKELKKASHAIWSAIGSGWQQTAANILANYDEIQNKGVVWANAMDDIWDNFKEKAISRLIEIVAESLIQAALSAAGWAPAAALSATATAGGSAIAGGTALAAIFAAAKAMVPSRKSGGSVSEGLVYTHDDEYVLSKTQTTDLSKLLNNLNKSLSRQVNNIGGNNVVLNISPKGSFAKEFFKWFNYQVEINKQRVAVS